MAQHPGLGLTEEGQRAGFRGISLAAPTPLAAVGRAPGGQPPEIDTTAAATRARAPTRSSVNQNDATAPKSRIPQFSDDPLKATAFILSEAALSFAGRPTNLGKLLELESEDKRLAQSAALASQANKMSQASLRLSTGKHFTDRALQLGTENLATLTDEIAAFSEKTGIDLTGFGEKLVEATEGQIANLKTQLDKLGENPTLAFMLGDIDFADSSVVDLEAKLSKANGFLEEIAATTAKQKALAPGRVEEAKQIAEFKAELKGGLKGKKSAVLEEDGSVKSATSRLLKNWAVTSLGGTIDDRTGQAIGLTPAQAKNAIDVAAEAERSLKAGETNSSAQAIKSAAETVGAPEVAEGVEIVIPEELRSQLHVQNAEISFLLPMAESVLPQVQNSTGIVSNLSSFVDLTVGQLFEALGADDPVFFKDTQEARQDIRLFNQEVKRAVVNNPRFPKFEQDIVSGFLTDPDVWFENPATAVLNFKNLVDFLERKQRTNASLIAGKRPTSGKKVFTIEDLEGIAGGAN